MRIHRFSVALTLVLMAAGAAIGSAAGAGERDDHPYLALGDSVPFGMIPNAGFQYVNPANFIGYPDYVARDLKLDFVNGSCPGETTGSFLSPVAPDLGCRGFRAQAPLHVPYATTQMVFATAFLKAHRNTRLVTISLGADDLFLLQGSCPDVTCVLAQLPAALGQIAANLTTTLAAIRDTGYDGPLVLVNYYSPDFSDASATQITKALDDTLAQVAAVGGAIVADAFTPFSNAVSNPLAGSSPCRAGLLLSFGISTVSCDVHPTPTGHQLIAAAVEQALRNAGRHSN
jgi:lysophospholipase L1-like esterase